jgi:fructose-bisphosphate aldolase class I
MNKTELLATIKTICTNGKGILAADESTGTIGKRFKNIDVENTHQNRVNYRDLLFTTPNLNEHISGVITYEETLFDVKEDGTKLIQPLIDNGIAVGIKVDMGVKSLYNEHDESITQGLDDLEVRCKKYYEAGARFAKWRSVLKIDSDNNLPSDLSIISSSFVLARYASICQNNGLVPIVEPEILMDGDHSIEYCNEKTALVLTYVYDALKLFNVDIECTLLKPNMVRQGVSNTTEIDYGKIAEATIDSLKKSVPAIMPGVVFLSGGMSEVDASIVLNEINKIKNNNEDGDYPWYLTFSYGRALQSTVLESWRGLDFNVTHAQGLLLHRCRANGYASMGVYENETNVSKSLHEHNYNY